MPDNANLYQRNDIWWCKFKVRGKQVRRTLRTSSIVEARKRRDELKAQFQQYRFDGSERHTWKEAVIEWAKHAPSSLKPRSIERYKMSLIVLRPFLDSLYVDEISTAVISKIAFRDGVTNATRRRDLTAVSNVLGFCIAKGWRETNPAKYFDRSVIKELREPFVMPADEDIPDLIAAAPAMWGKAIAFALASGMREEEVFSLERSQIKPDGVMLTHTKTNSPRLVDWDGVMREIVDSLPVHFTSPYLFWHDDGQRYHNLASQFLRIRAQANRARRKLDAKAPAITLTFHGLRHLHAIRWLAREGRDRLPTLSLRLGHDSVKTTEWYLKYLPTDGGTKRGTAEKAG
ncbi:MAG: tyrosine-type recombinase/integrase [Pikeienuella sp.]